MGRIDGTQLKLDPLKRIEPHVMKRRCDSEVYLTLQYEITRTLEFIERFNQNLGDKERLKIFHVFLCALVRSIALHPELNRFIAGRKYWQRNEILLSFVIKKELKYKSEETLTKVQFSPFETLDTVRKKIHSFVDEARSEDGSEAQGQIDFFGKLPRFLLMFATKMIEILEFFGSMPKGMVRTDPLYTSAVIANLGSVRIKGGVLHHSYMYGTASLFITINRIHKAPVVDEKTHEIKVEDVIDFGFTIDERISEGFSLGEVLQDFRKFIENPELLTEIPLIPEDRLEELQLKNLEDDPLYKNNQAASG
ncbi:MAG: 2-oxo acid dehydrogenase subunit E2 [Acidobacteria bacterium]|nr:2-oxo acid dehydrogenase subunit E2 [Acidobacteriota bacterium]